MRSASAMRAGILLGLVIGAADAAAVLIENPRSFSGWRSPAAFVGASLLLHLALGFLAGAIFALVRRIRGTSAHTLFTIGLAVALFVWIAIRVHVRWYFGEPLTSARSAPAYTATALGAIAVAFLLGRMLRRPIEGALTAKWGRALPLLIVACGLLVVLGQRRASSVVKSGEGSGGHHDLLLITLDTVRADHLSCYGYPRGTTPAIDRLARRGMIRSNAYSPIPLTNPSHTTMLTGLPPREHGVLNNGMRYEGMTPTCVELLAGKGFRAGAFVSGIPLKAGLSGLDRGFSKYDDSFSVFDRLHPMVTSLAVLRAANRVFPIDLVERRAHATVAAARSWVRSAPHPMFAWVHLYDPHSPYDAPAILRARFARESAEWSAHRKPVTEWPVADYDAELREMDRHLEDLLREMEIRALGRPAAERPGSVVVTADHGEGLEQHGELTHGSLLHEEDLRVPMIFAPATERLTPETTVAFGPWSLSDSPFSLDWIARGLLNLAGLDPPAHLLRPTYERGFLSETFAPEGRESKAAIVETVPSPILPLGRKLIVNFATGETQAYDLDKDPGETRPLDSSGEDWASMRAKIPAPDSTTAATIDPEVKRRLESLGYVH